MLTLGVVTDMHFGPKASFGGKLRKLSHLAPALLGRVASRMRDELEPDVLVNLGDVIEDADHAADARAYGHAMEVLRSANLELVHVAGNHDRKNLSPAELRSLWGDAGDGPLYRSFDRAGFHMVVLYTHETKDVDVRIDDEQLAWLEADLAQTDRDTVVLMHHSAADQDLRGNRWFEKAAHICLVRERKRLRAILEAHGRTRLVLNGHLHWNHLDVIGGIPYVTVQSLIENVEDDAPGVPADAHAIVRLDARRTHVEVYGAQPVRYQFERRAP